MLWLTSLWIVKLTSLAAPGADAINISGLLNAKKLGISKIEHYKNILFIGNY
jgi:hypothetical protein